MNSAEWEDFAQIDPYWSILTERSKKFGKWDINEFFATGEKDVKKFIEKIERYQYDLKRKTMLDFGCGVGRITQAMAEYFDTCYGLDISPTMISIAQSVSQKKNCKYVLGQEVDIKQFENDYFDLIYSRLVLQHIPEKENITGYIVEFMRILKPSGILVFQLPSSVPYRLRRKFYYLLYPLFKMIIPLKLLHRLNLVRMRMTSYPESEVIDLIKKQRGKILLIEKDADAGTESESRTYYITK